jgi:hypothetical protein
VNVRTPASRMTGKSGKASVRMVGLRDLNRDLPKVCKSNSHVTMMFGNCKCIFHVYGWRRATVISFVLQHLLALWQQFSRSHKTPIHLPHIVLRNSQSEQSTPEPTVSDINACTRNVSSCRSSFFLHALQLHLQYTLGLPSLADAKRRVCGGTDFI